MNQYLLFDLDGTLTDPKLGITTCVQYALHDFGIDEPDLDKLEPFIGPPLKDSFMEFYGMEEEQAEKAIEKYRERFRDTGMFENEVYPGIRRMLKHCKHQGAVLAVASSKPEVFVKKILEHFHLAQYFDVIVGSELDGRRTDKEEVVKEALHQLFPKNDIDYDNTVMIGDRKFDIIGAKDNKVVSVGVSYGYGSMEELQAAGADYIARTVEELEELLLRGRSNRREKAMLSWQKPNVLNRLGSVVLPLAVYVIASDALRFLAAVLAGRLSPFLPEAFIHYDEAGKITGLTGDAAAVVNSILFFLAFLLIYFLMGSTDLIQEKFAFRVRNANELQGTGFRPAKQQQCVKADTGAEIKYHAKRYLLYMCKAICIAGLGVGAAVFCNFFVNLLGFTRMSADFQAVSARQMTAGLLTGAALYGFFSPLAEEMIFRGVLFVRLKRFLPVTAAGLLSALLFGIYHGNLIQALYGFLAGCLFAWFYHKKGSFAQTVALHGVMNITGFLLTYFNVFSSPLYGWAGCAGAFVLTGLCFLMFYRL